MRTRLGRTDTRFTRGLVRAGLALGLAALLAAPLCACAGGGGGVSPGERRTAQTRVDEDPMGAMGYRLAWRGFPIVSRRVGVRHFDVFDEGVVVQDGEGTLSFMDQSTGRNIWVRQIATPRTRFIGNTIVGDRVISASDNEMYFLDLRTGDLRDRQRLAMVVNTRPVAVDEMIVFGSATGELLGHNIDTGFKAWGYQLEGSIEAPPVRVGPYVGAVSQAGDVIIIRPESGASTGRARLFAGLRNRPVADERTLYVASLDQSVYGFAGDDGRRVWRHRTERTITAQPAVSDGVLYVAIPDEGLVAMDTLDGAVLWTAEGLDGEVVATRPDRVLVWDGSSLTGLDIETGEVIDRVALPGVVRILSRPMDSGDVYTLSRDGVVARYTIR